MNPRWSGRPPTGGDCWPEEKHRGNVTAARDALRTDTALTLKNLGQRPSDGSLAM